jgi:HEAT repeat-containing protein 4
MCHLKEIVSKLIEEYLDSDHSRERILAAKLIPCMRRSISREATKKLIHLMWYDMNANVKKVAAQTLGRTGRGREVHNEINNRLESKSVFDRIEALKKINFIGIMTNKMINNYLKCFRDDHISVRGLACRSAQCLWEKDQKLIDTIVFMAKYDQVTKLKALAIQSIIKNLYIYK